MGVDMSLHAEVKIKWTEQFGWEGGGERGRERAKRVGLSGVESNNVDGKRTSKTGQTEMTQGRVEERKKEEDRDDLSMKSYSKTKKKGNHNKTTYFKQLKRLTATREALTKQAKKTQLWPVFLTT